ncbi:MAG TPA: molybdopterin-guanine dinucleotide biosynthesis protein B [Candidatus Limnocylindria bacterium]|nr:molybdopterin-guanine dinucleotide biosynthesis protein B [Candidatus Limnocylindria bacterium]
MKAPRIAFVGRHNSGKTTLLLAVLPLLVAKGLRVGYLKHAHAGFEIDQPEKDSYRARRTGVVQTIVTGGAQTAVIDDARVEQELTLEPVIARYAREDLDLIVVEGFKAEPLPKIEVARAALSTDLLCLNDRNLVATVSDFQVSPAVPHFGLGDARGVADFILSRIGARE